MSRFFRYNKESGSVEEVTDRSVFVGSGFKPLECIASGVNAAQATELRDFFRNHGELIEVTADGNPVYTSSQQRRRCMKIRGIHDNNCYF